MQARVTTAVLVAALAGGCAAEASNAASGEPIKIGFVNNEQGAFAAPQLKTGSEVAVQYLNRNGGIKGRPIDVVRCATDGTPEQSAQCAEMFVREKVVVSVEGVDTGADAATPILTQAGIPIVGHVQFSPGQMQDQNSYFFGAAAVAYGTAALKYYADQGVKTVTWLLPDAETSHAFTETVARPTAQRFGLRYKTIYYDAADPQWTVLAQQVLQEGPEASGSIAATEEQCAHMVRALRDVNYNGRILASSCTGLPKAVGKQSIGVELSQDHWNPGDPLSAPPANQEEIKVYDEAMKEAGHTEPVPGAVVSFADTMTLSRVLSTINGPITASTVGEALRGVKNLDSFLGPQITCDHGWMGNSACHTALLFYRFQPNGALKAQVPDYIEVSKLKP
ncbi:ABC transporter substrate-binding protein [Lentzea sp. NBRC 105346]|uniref:ABC transporter substrate-binding protein n=1 Tax=Lentzea sp. NBRC 105346 TaxID=3032205 RepID=UPI0024A46715|nr:ABC transporter substrate-binding protein [Lentzea sp. NBRC 105346]GLZ33720.1 ABC transporter substrate-binding protein [Lentzea sp. NBRC 105346]